MTEIQDQPTTNAKPLSSVSARDRRQHWLRRTLVGAGLIALVLLITQLPTFVGSSSGKIAGGEPPDWRTDFNAALAEASETGKPVLIDFTATWCPPCQVMERETWPDPAVRAAIDASVIPLHLDIDKDDAKPVANAYGVMYLPTIVLVNPDGTEIMRSSGMLDAKQMRDFLREALAHRPTTQPAVESQAG